MKAYISVSAKDKAACEVIQQRIAKDLENFFEVNQNIRLRLWSPRAKGDTLQCNGTKNAQPTGDLMALKRKDAEHMRRQNPELNAMRGDEAKIEDAFYRDLAFGTGGLRGVLGAGTNRMNVHTVAKASQGLANYVINTSPSESARIAISYDSRIKSAVFSREAAEVFAANGIRGLYLSPADAHALPVLCRARPGLRRGRDGHGQPQPRQVQRLQGLRRGRLPDHHRGGGGHPRRDREAGCLRGREARGFRRRDGGAADPLDRRGRVHGLHRGSQEAVPAGPRRGDRPGRGHRLYAPERHGPEARHPHPAGKRLYQHHRGQGAGAARRQLPHLPLSEPGDPRGHAAGPGLRPPR